MQDGPLPGIDWANTISEYRAAAATLQTSASFERKSADESFARSMELNNKASDLLRKAARLERLMIEDSW